MTVSGGTLTTAGVEVLDTIIEVSGGTMDVNGTFESGLFSGSESSVTVSGGTLTLDGVYTGNGTTVMVLDGTLDINQNLENWGEFWFMGGEITLAEDKVATFKPVGLDQGTVYYVATGGNDGDPGTFAEPWATLQHAADTVSAGDTVLVRGGTYTSTGGQTTPFVIFDTTAGELARPITFRPYDEENEPVTLNGGTNHANVLVQIELPFVNLEGFILTAAGRHGVLVPMDQDLIHHVAIRRCTAYDNDYTAGFAGAALKTTGPVQYVVFEECVSYGNHGGIQLREDPNKNPQDPRVPPYEDEFAYNIRMPEELWASWAGWTDRAARYCIVRRCLAYDNVLDDEHTDGIACRYAMDCLFEDNAGWGNIDDNFDLLGATRCIARRNIAFGALGTGDGDGNGIKIGVRRGLENLAHHNVSFENPRSGLDMADTQWPRVYNNTCY